MSTQPLTLTSQAANFILAYTKINECEFPDDIRLKNIREFNYLVIDLLAKTAIANQNAKILHFIDYWEISKAANNPEDLKRTYEKCNAYWKVFFTLHFQRIAQPLQWSFANLNHIFCITSIETSASTFAKELYLAKCGSLQITAEKVIELIQKFPNLLSFYFFGASFTNEAINPFIYFYENQMISLQIILKSDCNPTILKSASFNQLISLNLNGSKEAPLNDWLEAVCYGAPNLESIQISECENFSSEILENLISKKSKTLKLLNIRKSIAFKGENLTTPFPFLRSLLADSCKNLDLEKVLSLCPSLEILYVPGIFLKEDVLKIIFFQMPNLKHLCIDKANPAVLNKVINELSCTFELNSNLQRIDINYHLYHMIDIQKLKEIYAFHGKEVPKFVLN